MIETAKSSRSSSSISSESGRDRSSSRDRKTPLEGARNYLASTIPNHSRKRQNDANHDLCVAVEQRLRELFRCVDEESKTFASRTATGLIEWITRFCEEIWRDNTDVGNALTALGAAIASYMDSMDDSSKEADLRQGILSSRNALYDLIQPPAAAGEYVEVFSVVEKVNGSISRNSGALSRRACALLHGIARFEKDRQKSGWRWTPAELKIWTRVACCLYAMEHYFAGHDDIVRRNLSMLHQERIPARNVDWALRISPPPVHEAESKRPSMQDRRTLAKLQQQSRSFRSQKIDRALKERADAEAKQSREENVGIQTRIAWTALGKMIEAKKERLRRDSQD